MGEPDFEAPHSSRLPAANDADNDGPQWFAVRVKSNREKVVADALRGHGYEEFLPTFRRPRDAVSRSGSGGRPMFPGYVFGKFDKSKRLPILMVPGVLHIVGIGKEPVPVDSAEIASIRVIVNSPFCAEPCSYVGVGQSVSVVCGPLTGAQGVIVAIKNQWRLVASLTLLQRSIAVEIDREWVEPFESSSSLVSGKYQ